MNDVHRPHRHRHSEAEIERRDHRARQPSFCVVCVWFHNARCWVRVSQQQFIVVVLLPNNLVLLYFRDRSRMFPTPTSISLKVYGVREEGTFWPCVRGVESREMLVLAVLSVLLWSSSASISGGSEENLLTAVASGHER